MSDLNFVIDEDGDKCWYKDGKLHREDGPAVEYVNGTKEWYLNGELHRDNGPAFESSDGMLLYFLFNVQIVEEDFLVLPRNEFGKVHDVDMPFYSGVSETLFYIINGNKMSEEEFLSWKLDNELPQSEKPIKVKI